tara:strand:+ start:67 stop:402 length:336 start_codon:yes stop_codon:yes gene_type:complete
MSIATAILSITLLTTEPLPCPPHNATLAEVAAAVNVSCTSNCTYLSVADGARVLDAHRFTTFGNMHVPYPVTFMFADVMLMLGASAVLACFLIFTDGQLFEDLNAAHSTDA